MNTRSLLILGGAMFVALLVLSVVFFKERTAFIDIAYHLFCIVKDETFAIQNYRFGSFFTQLFPLLTSKLNCSLSTVAISYSISFIVLPLLTFLIILLGFKNTKVSIAYLLFVSLLTTHTFYWTQSELPQAMAFLFLFVAMLDNQIGKEKITKSLYFIGIILLTVVCFTHPLSIFAFAFLMAFYWLSFPEKRKLLYRISLAFAIIYTVKSTVFITPYDLKSVGGLSNFVKFFPHYLGLQSNKNLYQNLKHDYYIFVLATLLVCGYYLYQKDFKKLFLVVAAIVGYTFIVNIKFAYGDLQFYLENQYLLLGIFVGIPLSYDVLANDKFRKFSLSIVTIICFFAVFRIYNAHKTYTQRLEWNRNFLAKTAKLPQKKLIIPAAYAPMDTLLMTWGASYEFWILSTLESNQTRSIIIENDVYEFDWAKENTNTFISKWGNFDYHTLNKNYFKFSDTTSRYQRITEASQLQ